jgi:LuxR family transcriptional regulator, maltose regulon positive regulatory protein
MLDFGSVYALSCLTSQSKLKNSSRGGRNNGKRLEILSFPGKQVSQMQKESGHLIHEKIVVPPRVPRISRTRLLQVLDAHIASYNATIINGRAGTGKTTLAVDFARHVQRSVAWYKVDAADSDLATFCEYLSRTVKLRRPSIVTERLLQLTEAVESDRAELLAEAFVFQLSETRGEPLLIIIEDLHLVYDADWLVPFFRRLLPLLPTDVHLLITGRSLPPAPLWRLRSKQMLRVLDEDELAFTLDETMQLFKTYGLGEEHAQVAWERTNGRAATIAEFAAIPGRAGRALADNFLSINSPSLKMLARPVADFQT